MAAPVGEVAASLVREYLSRKGLKRTIACMDEEHPRTDASINNRSDLRQILHMEGLYKMNKTQDNPLKSMLEIIVKYHTEGQNDKRINFNSDLIQKPLSVTQAVYDNTRRKDTNLPVGREMIISRSLTEVGSPSQGVSISSATDRHSTRIQSGWTQSLSSESRQDQQHGSLPSFQDNDGTMKMELLSDKYNAATESTQKNRTSRIRRGMMAGPIVSSTEKESNRKRQTRKLGVPNSLLGADEDNGNSRASLMVSEQKEEKSTGLVEFSTTGPRRGIQHSWDTQAGKGKDGDAYRFEMVEKNIQKPHKTKTMINVDDMAEMILDDIDDDEELAELSTVSFQSRVPPHSHDAHPMDQNTAIALKEIIFGSSTSCFNAEWRSQSFTFLDAPDVRYGIVQKKGGPCGVLASIQAFMLKKLLFEGSNSDTIPQRLRPSNTLRTKCLALVVADVLWMAGEGKKATIAITSGRNHFIPTGQYRSDGVLEKITCITVDNMTDLQLLLDQHINQFETGTLGCILLTISVILSRTIDRVREDMDVPTATLLGAHGYCTQELVNLLLCGQAVSNVFDNDMELDSGNGNLTLLRGIKCRCDIGLLSLFEHYNICKVGSNLKTPRFPIWVVCSESHFSVLFGLQMELLTNQSKVREFDLHYYDGLANQQEEIRLTVYTQVLSKGSQDADTDLIPPLEHCIRTKWSDAVVNWNDTEPII